ncbi:hypothetical protein P7C73_g2224, partial [Tremellales sp. Uapishka_1]
MTSPIVADTIQLQYLPQGEVSTGPTRTNSISRPPTSQGGVDVVIDVEAENTSGGMCNLAPMDGKEAWIFVFGAFLIEVRPPLDQTQLSLACLIASGANGFEWLIEFVGSCMLGVALLASMTAFTRKRIFRGVDVQTLLDSSLVVT